MSGYLTSTIYGPAYVAAAIPPGGMALGFEMALQSATSPYGGMNILRYVQCNTNASNSLKVGAALKMIGQDIVDMTSATGDIMVGCNDIAGVVIPAGDYFWMNRSGMCKVLVAESQTAGVALVATSTTGTMSAWTTQDTVPCNTNVILLANSSASLVGPTLAFKD